MSNRVLVVLARGGGAHRVDAISTIATVARGASGTWHALIVLHVMVDLAVLDGAECVAARDDILFRARSASGTGTTGTKIYVLPNCTLCNGCFALG